MDQGGISRPYRLKDVKKCFGQLSDAVVLQWYKRGLVAGEMIPRGSRSQFAFSFAEIVHIGVIADMAQYGLTTNIAELCIWMDIVNDMPLGQPFNLEMSLTKPQGFTILYEMCSYDLCLLFDQDTMELSPQAKRNRRLSPQRYGRLISPLEATKQLVRWTSGLGYVNTKATAKDKFGKFSLTLNTGSALAFIYIPRLASRAAAALKLPDPWERQPTLRNQYESILQEIIERLETW